MNDHSALSLLQEFGRDRDEAAAELAARKPVKLGHKSTMYVLEPAPGGGWEKKDAVTWDRTAETLQTVLRIIQEAQPGAWEYLQDEMQEYARQELEGSPEQYELMLVVSGSEHRQASE